MHPINEDTITQAVIARHAGAGDPRLRELMTSLVQHLHGFTRDVKLSEGEWAAGLGYLGACSRADMALLSDALGLTALVTAANQRRPRGCTEAALASPGWAGPVPTPSIEGDGLGDREPCYLVGQVRSLDGAPIADAEVRLGPALAQRTDADGRFIAKTVATPAEPIAHDGPVGRLLQALGRPPWRAAHLPITIRARGYEPLQTQLFRQGDPHVDADAAFGVRPSLLARWVRHAPGTAPDGQRCEHGFSTVDFVFVLNNDISGDPR